jgi:hypothetical protein
MTWIDKGFFITIPNPLKQLPAKIKSYLRLLLAKRSWMRGLIAAYLKNTINLQKKITHLVLSRPAGLKLTERSPIRLYLCFVFTHNKNFWPLIIITILIVSIHKWGFLFKIKACEKNNHRHMYNIPRIYPPQEDYFLSITKGLDKKTIYG